MIEDNFKLINFYNLNEEEMKLVFNWRNNELIRKWMYNQEIIELDKHLEFIKNLKNDKKKIYFLVKNNKKDIGVIYFDNINKTSLKMGIYANPELKGVGKFLMNILIDYSFNQLKVKKIISEVFAENIKAYSLYKSFNFKNKKSFQKKNKNIIYMELDYENR